MKEGFLKTVKVVTFAAGVLTVLTGCSLEDNLTNEPIKPEAIVLPSEKQPFLAPKETEVVLRELEERVSYPSIKVVNKSRGGSRKSKPNTPKIVGKYSVDREQIQRSNNMGDLNF